MYSEALFYYLLSISWYKEIYSEPPFYYLLSISWYQEFDFLVSRNGILDMKNLISWYQGIVNISWYQEIVNISWYQEIELLI